MFEKALIALDLSPAEEPLLACLPALRQWGVSRLVLSHVVQIAYLQGAPLAHSQDYLDWLEQCARPLRAAGFAVEVEIRASGVIADEVLALAAEMDADLIVIGSRGQSRLGGLFLGSVARALLRTTTMPVLLQWIEPDPVATRARCEAVCTETLRHVLLATDFSPRCEAAERAALALAPRTQRMDCIHVLAVDEKPGAGLSASAAQAALSSLLGRIEAHGCPAAARLLEGTPVSAIIRYAEEADVSLIVVGKNGRGWIASRLIGSTAASLCEIAGRPVLMVP